MLANLVAFALLLHGGNQSAQVGRPSEDLQTKLNSQVTDYKLEAGNFVDALAALAQKFELPMGVEWSRDQQTSRRVSRSWNSVSVRQIVQDVVKAEPGYEFSVSEGVVHVLPIWTSPESQDFTRLKLGGFEVHNQVIQVANRRLQAMIAARIAPPVSEPPGAKGSAGSQFTSVGERMVNVHLGDVTVRTALDQLALSSDWRIWVVTFTDSDLPSGFRRTQSLWSSAVIPDEYQPVWNVFHWGDRIPRDHN